MALLDDVLKSQNYAPQDFERDGFILPPIPNSDGNGLPSTKIKSQRRGSAKRNLAHWFVPEVGIIHMYVNPQSINYGLKKLITPERTKGGYIIQYWGEELTTLDIRGNTGSSGIEGINVLYEVYRSEQYTFDSVALTMAADSSVTGLNDIIDSALGNLGGFGNAISTATGGVLGLNAASQNVLPRNIPSLASMALGIEFYYNGWVFRGFFNSFNFTESATNLGLFEYNINFTVTQRRGYRTNFMAWHRSAIDGPSDAGAIPLSFSQLTANTVPAANPDLVGVTASRGNIEPDTRLARR
jgi:hypothetical protein